MYSFCFLFMNRLRFRTTEMNELKVSTDIEGISHFIQTHTYDPKH